jgi:signal transduction histidine kinase
MASAGSTPPSWPSLESAAAAAMSKGLPVTFPGNEGAAIVAAPLVVQRGPTGAVVIETAPGIEPTEDDLDLLALFTSQAAVAVRNTHELERLRSGALAALGRMATEVAHELKNPLAGLRLYARHLEARLAKGGDADGAGLAQKITSTVDHLATVVQEITAFGRPPELHRVATNIHALLDECLAFAQAKCEAAGVEVVRGYDAACPAALLDARELRKAFLNLVLNGMEALGAGGKLTVTTSYAPETRMVTVVVEDNGVGMSEETLSRMFDLFFTTKPQGTGLGMALARSVIDLHAGELAINSAPGKGTRVTVRLPVEPASINGVHE